MEEDGYEIRMIDEGKGKGLFARHGYKKEDVILTEKPIVCCQFLWGVELGYSACDNCMKPLETAEENARRLTEKPDIVLPYMECCETNKDSIVECEACGTKYCCNDCLNEAVEKYHKTLCLRSRDVSVSHPLKQLTEAWKETHYPPETATIMLPARIIALINQSPDKSAVLSTFAQFCQKTVNDAEEITHNLLGEKFDGQIDNLRVKMMDAMNTSWVSHWFTPEGFRSLLALVGTNGQGIGTTAVGRWAKNVMALELSDDERISFDKLLDDLYYTMGYVSGEFLNNEGSGLYKIQSTINHSCSPNAIIKFPSSNSTLVAQATRDIAADEEICISYLDECELERSRHSRQKILRSLYLFTCRCEKCQAEADDPDVSSEEEVISYNEPEMDSF